jgi:hypothetical protein
MTNPSKDRGTRWETAVAAFLRDAGFEECYRMAPAGEFDAGDLGGIPEVAFECRDRNRLTLSENVDDANDRAHHKGADYGVTVMKRRGRGAKDAYVAMDLATFVRLLQDLVQHARPDGHV